MSALSQNKNIPRSMYNQDLNMILIRIFVLVYLISHADSQKLRVATQIAPPFVELEEGIFQGYAIDVLNELGKALNFTVELHIVQDGNYGTMQSDGTWNGIIGEIIRGDADMGVGAISISADREYVVDFTETIYDLVGITILRPTQASNNWIFEFLVAFRKEVWLALLACMGVMIILLTLVERLSPYSFTNKKEETQHEADFRMFSLKESIWFCVTSLSPQGGGETPRNISGRILVVTYWFFIFIILETFTANLAAYLTVSKNNVGIGNIEDLADQSTVEFFVRKGTFVETFFQRRAEVEATLREEWLKKSLDPKSSTGAPVWNYPMESKFGLLWSRIQANGMVSSTEEALIRLKDTSKRYAYIGDAAEIRYAIETDPNCGLEEIGTEFSRQPYGIVLKQGNPLRRKITAEILSMATKLVLSKLSDKWWLDNPQIRAECRKSQPDAKEEAGINLNNFGGAIVIVGGGLVLCVPAIIAEYFYFKSKP